MSESPIIPGLTNNEQIANQIADISNMLNGIAATDRARLDEYTFREVFLPFFAGDEVLPYPQAGLGMWANLAGGQYHEVDIVTKEGQVLFTAPPIFDRSAVNPIIDGPNARIHHVIITAEQYNRVHPAEGKRYLEHELGARSIIMKVPPNVAKNLEAWNKIFAYFGRPSMAEAPKSSTAEENHDDGPGYAEVEDL